MQFQLNNKYIDQLQEYILHGKDRLIVEMLEELHVADIADVMEELKIEEAVYIYRLLPDNKAADTLIEIEEDLQEKILNSLTSKEIAESVIENIDSDDAADVISGLSDEKKEEVISHIGDEEQASDIIDLLNYPEGTAGALMAKELIRVRDNWTVGTCIREMRKQAEDIDNIYTIYVVNQKDILLGRLSLKELLFTSSSTRTTIKDVFQEEKLLKVEAHTSANEVASIMEKYDLVVLPVVGDEGQLLGRITIDDVVDVIKDEAEKDYQMASGISEDVESGDNVWNHTRARLPWLLIGMFGGLAGATIIDAFDIHEHARMAIFIPLIAAMGGNVGVQSSAIVVQGLANKSLRNDNLFPKLLKELGVGFLNGFICALIILSACWGLNFGLNMGLTVSISLFIVIIFAALFGTFIPLVLDKYKIDPALATGPFITTSNDIVGLIIYFSIGGYISSHFI